MIKNVLAWLLGVPRVRIELVDSHGRIVGHKWVFWITRVHDGKMFNMPLHQPVEFHGAMLAFSCKQMTVSEARVFAWGDRLFFWQALNLTIRACDSIALTIQCENMPNRK